MHLHDSLCFHTRYDIISWPEGFTGLVRVYEEAESLHPQIVGLSGKKWPAVWAAAPDLTPRGLSPLIC